MLNQLFDSVCVTSGYYHNKLYLCCPPMIRVYDENFQFLEEHNINALYIIKQVNDLIAVSDQSIQYLDDKFNVISSYQRQQRWNKITQYDDYLILEYKSEYQTIRRNYSKEYLKKKIIGFTNNPHNHLTYIQKTQNLRNNELVCGNKRMQIEIAVDEVFLISQKQTHYIYQSKLFPVVTIIDLKHQVELYCLDFQPPLDSVFICNDLVLLQSINSLYQLKGQQLQEHSIKIRMSCLIQMGDKLLYGSSHDNPIVCQDRQIVHKLQNIGHIIDIHPCQQICYITSCYKRYPISVFRRGINDKLLGKLKLDGRRPINIFMIDEQLALLQFIDFSQVYQLPQFQKIDFGLITSQITITIAIIQQFICQITRNGIFLIYNGKIVKDVQNLNVRDSKIEFNIVSIYERDNLLKIFIINNDQITLQSVHEMKDISAFSLINQQLYFAKWFDKNLYRLDDAIYYGDIQSTIVSIQGQEHFIYLGENEGQLVIINQLDYTIIRKFQIANSHPIRMTKYQDKILILSNQNYLLGEKLNIVNWEQVYQVSTCGDKLVGILSDQVQYITLNDTPGSQWQEIKAFEWYDVLGLRYFKDKLNVLVHDKNNYKIEAYQSNKFLRQLNLDFKPFKIEISEYICIIGNSDKFGFILILDDHYNVIIKQQLNEFVYALKYENNLIYYSTETAIHLLGVGLIYDFKLQIEFFEIKDNYYLICDSYKGTHLFLHDDRMICLGVILGASNFATFYFNENIIAFTKQKLIVAKPNSLFLGVTEQMETVTSINLYVTALKDQFYGTFWGQLGYFE